MAQFFSPGVYVQEVPSAVKAIAGVSTSIPGFIGVMPKTFKQPARDQEGKLKWVDFNVPTPAGKAVLITNWAQFGRAFGDFLGIVPDPDTSSGTPPVSTLSAKSSTARRASLLAAADQSGEVSVAAAATGETIDPGHRVLAHAVYGFFNNGGGSCFVAYAETPADIPKAVGALGAIDEVSMLCAPGIVADADRNLLIDNCEALQDRLAILDAPEVVADRSKLTSPASTDGGLLPKRSDYAAFYYPWVKVFDPAEQLVNGGDGIISVPPSGHVAGVYARSDTARGVFKSPANEVLRGALSAVDPLSKIDQDNLNPKGVNCIRALNGNLYVWGARTVGGDANQDLKYIATRRTLMFLRESIEEGTQWAVFEPNTPALWQKITRNVTAFLTTAWRAGALFGATPAEAFFVKCDAENNPPEQRDLGQVKAQIGVAIVRPAEFVVFEVSQVAPAK